MIGQPLPDLGVFVGAVVVEDGMDDLSSRDSPLDRIEELNELLMPVLLHAPPQHRAVEDIEGGEQGGGAVSLVIMSHGGAFAGFQRQAGLGPVECLYLAFLVDGQHHGMTGRLHVEADHILNLLGESRVFGSFEGAEAMGLKIMGVPEALHGAQADTHGLGDHPTRPMRGASGRFRARQGQNFRHGFQR